MYLHNSCTKKQFAKIAGVSNKSLQRWTAKHKKQLSMFGQKTYDKILLPKSVVFLSHFYEVTDNQT